MKWSNGSGPPPTLADIRAMARTIHVPRLRAIGTIGDLHRALVAGLAAGYEVREAGLVDAIELLENAHQIAAGDELPSKEEAAAELRDAGFDPDVLTNRLHDWYVHRTWRNASKDLRMTTPSRAELFPHWRGPRARRATLRQVTT